MEKSYAVIIGNSRCQAVGFDTYDEAYDYCSLLVNNFVEDDPDAEWWDGTNDQTDINQGLVFLVRSHNRETPFYIREVFTA